MTKQRTIVRPVSVSGRGLHSGNESTATFKPAPVNTGVIFYRTDLPERPAIPADIEHVVDTSRGTTIGLNGIKVLTVEHVLAAIVGLGIDNVAVELNANELPVGDGSAKPFVDVLLDAGLAVQDAERKSVAITEPVTYRDKDITVTMLPADELRLSFTIDYPNKMIGTQYLSVVITQSTFVSEIAPARTFCSLHEVEYLQAQGLIKGGSLDNAIVIGDDDILNNELRFDDEFVRHKILDLLGDMFLLGKFLKAHIIAIKSGHAAHVELARRVRERLELVEQSQNRSGRRISSLPRVGRKMDITDIEKALPHRYPFLLVDRIEAVVKDKYAVGIKNVTANEPFFQGHWPGDPVMPGVLIVEAIAQVGGLLVFESGRLKHGSAYFAGIDRARFRKAVRPGDQMVIETRIVRQKSRACKIRGQAFVDGSLVAETDLLFFL